MEIIKPKVIAIQYNDNNYRTENIIPPSQNISEKEKTPMWAFQNLQYGLSAYNQPTGTLNFPSVLGSDLFGKTAGMDDKWGLPINHMIRMMMYYQGRQPNLNYNHLVPNITSSNLQAQWIKGYDISTFVNYFKGIIMNKLAEAHFSCKPISKEAVGKRQQITDALMMQYDLQGAFDKMQKVGASMNIANKKFDSKESINKWMDTDFKEFASEVFTDIGNGIWFSNDWFNMTVQNFMYVVICSLGVFEHYVENGMSLQQIVPPFEYINDNSAADDDYGKYDQFRGRCSNMSLSQIFSRWEFTADQKKDIEEIASKDDLRDKYNSTSNFKWWTGNAKNTCGVVTMYWRTFNNLGKEANVNDIYKATLIGNKYLLDYGYIDNLVEEYGNKAYPEFPLFRFRPNTFLGESISEVEKVNRLQDEIDFYSYSIRKMIADAKGKKYFINAGKFEGMENMQQILEDFESMGFSILVPSGDVNNSMDKERAITEVDFTLDPKIDKIIQLQAMTREQMGKILNTSPSALGQQTRYIGANAAQNNLAGNNLGISYLIDGYCNFIVKNMYYAVNQQKNLLTLDENKEAEFMIGDRGKVFLSLNKELRMEEVGVEMKLNDNFDEKRKEKIGGWVLAAMQNREIDILDAIKLDNANSSTKMEDALEYSIKKKEEKENKKAEALAANEQALKDKDNLLQAAFVQLKEDNANHRTFMEQQTKLILGHSDKLMEMFALLQQSAPPNSPLEQGLAAQGKQQTAPQEMGQGMEQNMEQ